jgi:hypothetical protein
MPPSDNLCRFETMRMTRREVLRLAVVGGGGLAGMLLVGCGGEEKSA